MPAAAEEKVLYAEPKMRRVRDRVNISTAASSMPCSVRLSAGRGDVMTRCGKVAAMRCFSSSLSVARKKRVPPDSYRMRAMKASVGLSAMLRSLSVRRMCTPTTSSPASATVRSTRCWSCGISLKRS